MVVPTRVNATSMGRAALRPSARKNAARIRQVQISDSRTTAAEKKT